MKLLVVGAAGKTGQAVVERALRAGHEVTVLVHSQGYAYPGVEVHIGDASDAATVDAAVSGQDAVIDVVGGKTPYRSTTLETGVAKAIVTSMHARGVQRLVVTSSVGVGESRAHSPLLVKILVETFLRGSTRDKAGMEAVVSTSQLDWIITRPAVLTDKPGTGNVRVLMASDEGKADSLTRTDLAVFLVAQLTDDENLRGAITLANSR